jgi:hypothetical protein
VEAAVPQPRQKTPPAAFGLNRLITGLLRAIERSITTNHAASVFEFAN